MTVPARPLRSAPRGSRSARSARLAPVFPIALLLGACSAPPPVTAVPGTALADTIPAQSALRPLLKRWANALTREERGAFEADLRAFVGAYPNDGQVPAAQALLAWIAVERDDGKKDVDPAKRAADLTAGSKLAGRARDLGSGSWSDFATLVDGAIRRRMGDPRGAIAVLAPLLSKLIDAWARDLLNEEIISAAVAAGDTELAIKAMTVWLREAGDEERALVRSRVELALTTLGEAELVRLFYLRVATAKPSPDSDIDLLLTQRVAQIAIAMKDAILAKKLLLTSGPLLGEHGDEVAHLAAGATVIRVDARTIGVLLSFRTAETRRRSADLAAGVAWGLDLPGSGARLAVRDDAGEASRLPLALLELGRAGAAVVIAGIADEDARVAARFAEAQHMPVILISRPPDAALPQGGFAFALGASPEGWLPDKDPRLADGRLTAWKNAYGSLPSFWAAAGRDAAVLARASVKDLPEQSTEVREEIEARRKTVRAALESAKPALWTVEREAPGAP